MAYLDDFFKDYGYGTTNDTSGPIHDPANTNYGPFYWGEDKNTSGQSKQSNNPASAVPGANGMATNPALGAYGAQTGGAQRPYSNYLYQNAGQSPQSGYSTTLSDMLKQYYR